MLSSSSFFASPQGALPAPEVEKVQRQAEEQMQATAAAEEAKKRAANEKALGNLDKLSFPELQGIAKELWPEVTPFVARIGQTLNPTRPASSRAAWAQLIRMCQQQGPDAIISKFST